MKEHSLVLWRKENCGRKLLFLRRFNPQPPISSPFWLVQRRVRDSSEGGSSVILRFIIGLLIPDSLRVGRSGGLIPVRSEFFSVRPNVSRSQPCLLYNACLVFSWKKRPCVVLTTHSLLAPKLRMG